MKPPPTRQARQACQVRRESEQGRDVSESRPSPPPSGTPASAAASAAAPVAAPALPTATDRLVAGYAALAVAINVLEAGFPSPIPGVKPGLANVITLIVLCRHGWRTAAAVALLRVLVGSLMVGSFLAPGFWMSAAGATAALAALAGGAGWNRLAPRWPLSVVGLSILSAEAHMLGQFTVARTLLIPNPGLLHLLAPLLAAALLFGGVTGLAAQRVLAALERGAGTAETGCGR